MTESLSLYEIPVITARYASDRLRDLYENGSGSLAISLLAYRDSVIVLTKGNEDQQRDIFEMKRAAEVIGKWDIADAIEIAIRQHSRSGQTKLSGHPTRPARAVANAAQLRH
jgi:hypothetical protein